MPKSQCKNTINNSQANMVPLPSSYPMTARLQYSNSAEENNFRKMTEVLKEKSETKNSLKEIDKKTKNKCKKKSKNPLKSVENAKKNKYKT